MYLSWPVNVNIDIASNFSLIFPAVTICNSNNFRLSEAMKLETYQYLTDVFHQKANWEKAMEKLNEMNYTDLQIKLAHRKEHMILGCTWKSSQCSSANFTPILTDYGVCYTFNTNKDNILTVENTGAAFGLELLLNMERYEYMTGAHVSTGIRILMHNHNEKPRMADLGISIPASMNAMVAMELTELNDLAAPHGNCTKSDFRSREACIVDCRVDNLAHICHCRPMYATYKAHIPLCNATSHHICVKNVLGSHEGYEACNDKCKVPCKQLMYSASLSYTTTSDFMARAMAKKYASDFDLLNRSRIATLNLHHVDDTFLEEDNAVMSAFLNKYHNFYKQLVWLYESAHKNVSHIKAMRDAFEGAELCLQEKKSLYEETLKLHLVPGLVELTVERLRYEISDLQNRRLPRFSDLVQQNATHNNISTFVQQQFEEELWWLDHKMRIILSELELTESTYSNALNTIKSEYENADSALPMSILRPYEDRLLNSYSTFVNDSSRTITDVEHFLDYIARFRRSPNGVNLIKLYNETATLNRVLTEFTEATEGLESISNVIKECFRHEISSIRSTEQNIIGSAQFHARLLHIYASEFVESQPHLLEFGDFIDRIKNLTGGFQIQYLEDKLQNSDLWNHTISHTKNMMVTLDKMKAEAKSTILHSEEVLLSLETSASEFNGSNGCGQFSTIIELLRTYKDRINNQPNYIDSVQKDYEQMLTRHTNLDTHLQQLKDSYAISYKFIK
ncbi:acid-sensing ion channel 4-B-like [Tubulanus polymorphus]|uniref:acid-sensing ion channel 4-B-like n=1 Tax=Tubulanus polymorphus TaxID=672921 RepID=UPI003DA2A62B